MTAPLAIDGVAAPPRANGELVFAQPWESRAFGIAVALYEAGAFTWPRFQDALIARIAAWEDTSGEDRSWSYYDHWLGALEDVLEAQGAVTAADIAARTADLARRRPGYDHEDHGHDHDG